MTSEWAGFQLLAAQETSSLQAAIRLFDRQEFSEAQRRFEAVLAADPKTAEAHLYLGRIALEEEDFDEGVQRLERAVLLNHTNAIYTLWLARAYGLQAKKAGVPGGIGPALKSKAVFEKTVVLDPNLLEAREDLVQFHREAPGIIGGSRRVARAQANEIKKRDAYLGALVHGDLLVDEKKFHEAERAYRTAAELKPEQTAAYYRMGILYLETQEIDKAFAAFEKILLLNTNEVTACYYIGKMGALFGQRLPRAEEALQTYLKTKPWLFMPSLAAAHFCLGQIQERKENREQARVEYQAALKLEPGNKEAKAALKKLK